MPYIEAQDKNQMMMCSLDYMVDPESMARVIDKFVDGLDLEGMGFGKVEAAAEGHTSYDPRCLLKQYLYGSRKKLRLSRRLEETCHLNVEVKWLMSGLEPDFRTLSDFRKDNVECLKKVFHEFNHKLSEVLAKGFLCVDGSKSLTDSEAKLMKSKTGFMVVYNVQTAVDSETHMIEDYIVTNHVTDHGLLEKTVTGVKRKTRETVV